MGYLTAKQFSNQWGITERRIIKLCSENRINGAIKNGMVWLIPEDTIKPIDKRSKIAKYVNTQKRIMIVNINNQVGYSVMPLLEKEGYIIEGTYSKKTKIDEENLENIKTWKIDYEKDNELLKILEETNKYYDGLILINLEKTSDDILKKQEILIKEFSKKMNCESSIVLVNNVQNVNEKIEAKLANELKENIGVRINALNIDIPSEGKFLVNYCEIAEDVLNLCTKFKNTTGMSILTDGGCLEFNKNGRTNLLGVGEFYRAITAYLKSLNKQSYMWCASTMLEDEWTEEPLEMQFRVNNLDAANRGATLERIFIFSKNKIKDFRENKTLKIYMQSNIKTMFVDYDEIKAKEPELLKIVGDGWDGIGKETLIVDLPSGSEKRGYININKNDVNKAYECFERLKTYAKDLKEVLK